MAEKSEVVVLGCHLDDPATRSGMKKVLTRLQSLVPMKDKATGLGQKTLLKRIDLRMTMPKFSKPVFSYIFRQVIFAALWKF